jgi:hypothetical protein
MPEIVNMTDVPELIPALEMPGIPPTMFARLAGQAALEAPVEQDPGFISMADDNVWTNYMTGGEGSKGKGGKRDMKKDD